MTLIHQLAGLGFSIADRLSAIEATREDLERIQVPALREDGLYDEADQLAERARSEFFAELDGLARDLGDLLPADVLGMYLERPRQRSTLLIRNIRLLADIQGAGAVMADLDAPQDADPDCSLCGLPWTEHTTDPQVIPGCPVGGCL